MTKKSLSSLFSSSKTLSSFTSFSSSQTQTPSTTPRKQTFSDSMIQEAIEAAESIVIRWEKSSPSDSINKTSSPLFQKNRAESMELLKSVDQLRRAMHFLLSTNSVSSQLAIAQNLMQIAMKRLEIEFYQILSSKLKDGQKSSDTSTLDLQAIASCMISSGYGKECVGIYRLIRKSSLDEGLYMLGIEQFKSSRIQKMEWGALENTIKNWLTSTKVAMKAHFRGERVLCDNVFSTSATIRESCFSEITKEAAINLFKFPEMVAKRSRSVARVFQLMELYEALSELWPEIEYVFDFESTSSVRLQAVSSMVRLGGVIESTIADYEVTIQKDSSRALVPGGGIHPMTQSVMELLCSLIGHSGILSEILADHSKPGIFPLPEPSFQDVSGSPLPLRLARIILVLLCKLDSKAAAYKDISLSYLFLANNMDYIVQKVQATNLKILLGLEWVTEHQKKVSQYASSFELFAWNSVFLSLPAISDSSSLSAEVAKEWFGKFNAAFEGAYVRQASWTVPNRKLRNQIKLSVAKKLVPPYRDFHAACLEILSSEKCLLAVLLRFSPDDIENYLSDLYDGPSVSGVSSESLTSSSSFQSRSCLPVY